MKLLLSLMALFMLPSVAGLGNGIDDNTLGQNVVDNSVAYSPEAHHDANYYSIDLIVDNSLSYPSDDVRLICRTTGYSFGVQFSVGGYYQVKSYSVLDDGCSYEIRLRALYSFENVSTTITASQYSSQNGQYITRSETFYSVRYEDYISLSTTSMDHAKDCSDLAAYDRIPEHTRETDLPFFNYWDEKNNTREEPFVTSNTVSWRDSRSYRFYLRNDGGTREPLKRVNVAVFTPTFPESPQYVSLTDDNGEITVPWNCNVSYLRLMSCSVDHYYSDAGDPDDPDVPFITPRNWAYDDLSQLTALDGDNLIFGHGVQLYRAKDKGGTLSLYYKDFFVEPGTAMDFTIDVNNSSSFGKAMKIIQTLAYAKRYVEEMTGAAMGIYEFYNAYYPCSGNRSYYATKGSTNPSDNMYISEEDYANPDVILHEYGHCVQRKYGFGDSLGVPHYLGINNSTLLDDQNDGVRLAWGEAWPTVFANLVTRRYPSFFGSSDTFFDSHDCSFNLESPTVRFGPESEEDIAAVLYDLYDSNSSGESFDALAYGDKGLWDLMAEASPLQTFAEFHDYFRNTHSAGDFAKFQNIMREYGFSPNPTTNGNGTVTTGPTINWNTVSGAYSYDVVLYDGYGTKLLTRTSNTNSYSINKADWDKVLLSPTSCWYYEIVAKTVIGETIHSTSSGRVLMSKPSGIINQGSIYIDNTYEHRVVIQEVNLYTNTTARYDFHVNVSGYTTFQTVGPYGSRIEVFDSNNNLIKADQGGMGGHGYKSNGRQTNAFVRCYCYANANYKVLVRDCETGRYYQGKLIIMQPNAYTKGSLSYDSAYSLQELVSDNDYYYVNCYKNKTTVFNYSPSSSYGLFTAELSTGFDSYIYVVDTVTGEVSDDDDAAGNSDAKADFEAFSGRKYLIMITQFNPSNNISAGNRQATVHIYKN